ncbi:unnamed protein product, partial [Polarella glacialis]
MQASGQPPARLGVARDAEPEWTSHSSQNQASVPHSTMSMVPGAQPGVVNGSFRPVLTRQAVGSWKSPPGQTPQRRTTTLQCQISLSRRRLAAWRSSASPG